MATKCPKTGRFTSFSLVDDGTLDTVVVCTQCNEEFRSNPEQVDEDDRIACAKEWAAEDHEDLGSLRNHPKW